MGERDRFHRVAKLFESARSRRGPDRDSFLREACGGDEDLFEAVGRLLGHHEDEDAPLLVPLVTRTMLLPDVSDPRAALPEAINQYRIKRRLGVGGMGVVYLAVQERPRREVAVKVIRPGIATRELLRRFELEAAMLGRLQHPGIAQIYEAGTYDDGVGARPYFAMEYVDGAPLPEHVRTTTLGTRERLDIFARICDAVHHAHQRGVIHRDLKPGNVLVDGAGQPKILDFGVARATDCDLQVTTMQTREGQLVGTLPYMSPEQIGGRAGDVDVRSDIYALGVILYELLADQLPYKLADVTLLSAAKMIAEEEPTPLSAIDKSYRGDLNTIVLKALEKDPDARYQSASDLGADVRRFLADQPIVARPATTLYQLRKFAKRNKALVSAASMLLVTIVAAGAVSLVYAVRADAAARRERWQAYLANIGGADSALQLHDVITAERRLLAVDDSDRDNWEWRHLMSRLDQSAGSFGSEHEPLVTIAFSPDGSLIATGTLRSVAQLWDAASGSLIRSLGENPFGNAIRSLAFSPNGSVLLTTGSAGAVRLWDVQTGEELAPLGGAPRAAWSVDWRGDLIALCLDEGEVGLWSAATGAPLYTLAAHEPGESVRARFSPGTDRLATASSRLRIWQTATGRLLAECPRPIDEVAWHPGGLWLAGASPDGRAGIYDAATGEEVVALRGHEGRVRALGFSPDGERLFTGGVDRTVRLWDTVTGEQLAVLHAHRFAVTGADWSPDGRLIATIGSGPGPIHLWRGSADDDPFVLHPPAAPRALAATADGSRLLLGDWNGEVHLLDGVSGALLTTLWRHEGGVLDVACSPDGRVCASGGADGFVRLADARTASPIGVLTVEQHRVVDLEFSADSARIAVATIDPDVKVWDARSGTLLHTLAGLGKRVLLAYSRDGRFLATGAENGAIRVWDAQTGLLHARVSESAPDVGVRAIAFAPDGTLVSAHDDARIRAWDPRTGSAVSRPLSLPSLPSSIAFIGDRLIIGTMTGNVRLCDWPTRDELLVLRGLADPVALAAFDDRIVALDRTRLRLWDVKSPESMRRAQEAALPAQGAARPGRPAPGPAGTSTTTAPDVRGNR